MTKKWSKKGHLSVINFQDFFFQNLKKMEKERIVFYVAAFDSIKIQTPLASQNDRHNLSFLKDIYVVGEKMTRNGGKMANTKLCVI